MIRLRPLPYDKILKISLITTNGFQFQLVLYDLLIDRRTSFQICSLIFKIIDCARFRLEADT